MFGLKSSKIETESPSVLSQALTIFTNAQKKLREAEAKISKYKNRKTKKTRAAHDLRALGGKLDAARADYIESRITEAEYQSAKNEYAVATATAGEDEALNRQLESKVGQSMIDATHVRTEVENARRVVASALSKQMAVDAVADKELLRRSFLMWRSTRQQLPASIDTSVFLELLFGGTDQATDKTLSDKNQEELAELLKTESF